MHFLHDNSNSPATEFLIRGIHSLVDALAALHKIPSSLIFQKKWNWKLAICVIDTTVLTIFTLI